MLREKQRIVEETRRLNLDISPFPWLFGLLHYQMLDPFIALVWQKNP
jgi:hypothetical protein